MSEFEFLAGFYGLLLGLIVAEVASKLADAIDCRHERRIGYLTPLLALLVLGDVTSFWLWVWSEHDHIAMGWQTVYLSTVLGIIYFLAAALIFPRVPARWESLDEHYWSRKRWVIGGLLSVNAFVLIRMLTRLLPQWNDFWFFFWQLAFFVPMILLLFNRRRAVEIVLLGWLVLYYLVNVLPGMPSSQWSRDIGVITSASPPAGEDPEYQQGE